MTLLEALKLLGTRNDYCIWVYLHRNSNSRFLKFVATWFIWNSASLPLFATCHHYNADGFGEEPNLNSVSSCSLILRNRTQCSA